MRKAFELKRLVDSNKYWEKIAPTNDLNMNIKPIFKNIQIRHNFENCFIFNISKSIDSSPKTIVKKVQESKKSNDSRRKVRTKLESLPLSSEITNNFLLTGNSFLGKNSSDLYKKEKIIKTQYYKRNKNLLNRLFPAKKNEINFKTKAKNSISKDLKCIYEKCKFFQRPTVKNLSFMATNFLKNEKDI